MSHRVTTKRWTYDNAQHHVTAFWPISKAAHSWSYDIWKLYATDCFDKFWHCVTTTSAISVSLLIVVSERMPECGLNVSSAVRAGDFIELQCNVNYTGSTWIPRFCCFHQHHSGQCQTPIPTTEGNRHTFTSDFFTGVPKYGWLGSRVVSVLDSGAEGPRFKLQSRRCRVTVLSKLFTPIVPQFTKQLSW